ncbi:MAG TPA: hypothetical protein VGJ60_31355 [Chloroflexota bacterium]
MGVEVLLRERADRDRVPTSRRATPSVVRAWFERIGRRWGQDLLPALCNTWSAST